MEYEPYAASIVIPLLNQREPWLEQCVRSALGQSIRSQVIVVCSRHTRESNIDVLGALRAGNDNLVITSRIMEGFATALNVGIYLSSAPRVGFLLSDDWLDERTVEMCLEHTSDIVCTGSYGYAEDGARLSCLTKMPNMSEFQRRRSLRSRAEYLQHFFLFQKKALMAVGGVDEDIGLTGPDDFDLIWTLLEHGATVDIVEQHLYHRRDHCGDRLTLRDRGEQIVDLEKILHKHGIAGEEKKRIVNDHSRWFGKPLHMVIAEMSDQVS